MIFFQREKGSPELLLYLLDREVILDEILYFLISSFSVREMKANWSLSFVYDSCLRALNQL